MAKYSYSERAIADATGNLYKNTVDGKVAWSNREMLEIGTDNPFKRLKSIEWSNKRRDFQAIVDGVKKRKEIVAPTSEPMIIEQRKQAPPYGIRKINCVRLTDAKLSATIQDKYYNFFKARYPDCKFCVARKLPVVSPVSVYDKAGELVGLIMPMFV